MFSLGFLGEKRISNIVSNSSTPVMPFQNTNKEYVSLHVYILYMYVYIEVNKILKGIVVPFTGFFLVPSFCSLNVFAGFIKYHL